MFAFIWSQSPTPTHPPGIVVWHTASTPSFLYNFNHNFQLNLSLAQLVSILAEELLAASSFTAFATEASLNSNSRSKYHASCWSLFLKILWRNWYCGNVSLALSICNHTYQGNLFLISIPPTPIPKFWIDSPGFRVHNNIRLMEATVGLWNHSEFIWN